MEYTVTGKAAKIDFGAAGVAEVLQNVRMILTTPVFSVPLDREFGVDCSLLDRPTPVTRAKLTAQIFSTIRAYEPRAEIVEIDFINDVEDEMDGRLIPRVRVEVNV